MRLAALAMLLLATPVLAQPKDAPVRCLTAEDKAKLDAVYRDQHKRVVGLEAENAELRKRTQAIAESKQSPIPVVVAVLLGVAAGVSVTMLVVK